MYKKIILGLVLVAFVSVQLANSLQCYTCTNPDNCNTATKMTCNNDTANATRDALKTAGVQNVPDTVSNQYDCLHLRYINNSTATTKGVAEIAGCMYNNLDACSLQFNPAVPANRTACLRCSGELCNNPRNPAGTYSSSTFTIAGSALLLMIAKFLA